MIYLYKQYVLEVRRSINEKKYNHLSLVCELNNYNINHHKINYPYLFRQIGFKQF